MFNIIQIVMETNLYFAEFEAHYKNHCVQFAVCSVTDLRKKTLLLTLQTYDV